MVIIVTMSGHEIMIDDKGRRKAFASNNDDGDTVYTNIENETAVRPLTQIRTRLEHQLKGINKSYLKARRRERTNISTELMSLFSDIKKADGQEDSQW